MNDTSPWPTLTIYRRAGCHLCDRAEDLLHGVLEERARSGQVTPHVQIEDVSSGADLEARYGERVPVLAMGGEEVSGVTSERRLRAFLDRQLRAPA